MEIGTGIALGSLIFTIGIAAVRLIPTRSKVAVPQPFKKEEEKEKCPWHEDFVRKWEQDHARLQQGDEQMEQMADDITVTRKAVIAIATHLDVPLKNIKEELQDML